MKKTYNPIKLYPDKYSFNMCICVCCDSSSLDRHPKSEGWQVWVALREAPSCHPVIPPTPPVCVWARPDLGPVCHQQMGLSQKDPSARQAGLLHTRLNLNSKVRIDALSPW